MAKKQPPKTADVHETSPRLERVRLRRFWRRWRDLRFTVVASIRQAHGKYGSLAQSAAHIDCPAKKIYKVFHNVEAESRPRIIARSRAVDLAEFVKDGRLELSGDSRAGVGDVNVDRFTPRRDLGRYGDRSMIREFDRVVYEVGQNLL